MPEHENPLKHESHCERKRSLAALMLKHRKHVKRYAEYNEERHEYRSPFAVIEPHKGLIDGLPVRPDKSPEIVGVYGSILIGSCGAVILFKQPERLLIAAERERNEYYNGKRAYNGDDRFDKAKLNALLADT